METIEKTKIIVHTSVQAPIDKVWEYFTEPTHICQWNHASDDWHCPKAENDLQVGGKFSYTMAAKDGSFQFDFGGTYTQVIKNKYIGYILGDGREVEVCFEEMSDGIQLVESFDPENENSQEQQRFGWQSILDNFKKHTEEN